MYVKKSLMLWASVFALALPLFLANTANAIYNGDGTVQNGTTGGWDITDYGKCVTGVKADGTMVIDSTITSRPDCLIKTFPTYTTSASCLLSDKAGSNVEGSHYWASTCIANDGTAISLKDLDRSNGMCNQAAIKAGKTSGTMVNACTSAWVYTGPAGNGAPGFCYTTINLSSAFTTTASCPTSTVGYAWANPKCTFSYGITGIANAAINKKDGSGAYAAAGASVDLSALTQGLCIANGASWSTGVTKSGTTSVGAPGAVASTLAVVTGSRAGCLECHNSTSQNNGYAERWKDTSRMTGHKNMLRKVTAGKSWVGPDNVVYTAAATGAIRFDLATATIGTVDQPLLYIFGDWMAAAPAGLDVIVNMSGSAKYNGTSNYSCAPCHTTGWSSNDGVSGLCSQSSMTTASSCSTAGGTWYPMTGVQGASYTGAEPAASFPAVAFPGAGQWDRDGILCSRCHQSVFAQTGTNANGSAFAGPAGTSTHNVTPANTANEQVNNICFSCHQGIAKTSNGLGADNVNDPTIIPVKNNATAPAYVPEFNGHVLGNSFLNSPHSRFTGTIVPNGLGKYELVGNTVSQYNSAFKGFICRDSATAGGGNILKTVVKSGVISEIKTQADCISANTTSLTAGVAGMWQAESQGACTTCHDVHQSMFVTGQEGLKKECQTCHADTTGTGGAGYAAAGVPQINEAVINHPTSAGTPFDTTRFTSSCETCHMPMATSSGFPMHLWRINTDAAYSTFPTASEFGIGATATKKNANTAPDGTYANAVWVDVDLACGQCHGGSSTTTHNGAPYKTKALLAAQAAGMHSKAAGANAKPVVSHAAPSVNLYTVSFTDASTDDDVLPVNAISVNWGDGIVTPGNKGQTFSHIYASRSRTYTIVHTVTDAGVLSAGEHFTVSVPTKYMVSGVVTLKDGTTPLGSVSLALKYNGHTRAVRKSAANGTFSFTNVLPGSYTIRPYKRGNAFTTATVSNLSSDMTVTISAN